MAIALLASGVSKAGSGSTANYNTSTATLIIGIVAAQTISTGLRDSLSKTWIRIGSILSQPTTFSMQTAFYYITGAAGTIGGASHTFDTPDSTPGIAVLAFSGTATSSTLDQNAEAADQVANPSHPGSITPGFANEVLIFGTGGFNTGASTLSSFGSGVLQIDVPGAGGTNYGCTISYEIQTTATARNPGISLPSNSVGCHIASFKEGAAGSVATVARALNVRQAVNRAGTF